MPTPVFHGWWINVSDCSTFYMSTKLDLFTEQYYWFSLIAYFSTPKILCKTKMLWCRFTTWLKVWGRQWSVKARTVGGDNLAVKDVGWYNKDYRLSQCWISEIISHRSALEQGDVSLHLSLCKSQLQIQILFKGL